MIIYTEMGGLPETMFGDRELDRLPRQLMVRFYSSKACGSCHILSPLIDSLAEDHSDIIVLTRFDVEEDPTAAADDQVDRTPTLIFSVGDHVVDRIEGPAGRTRIAEGFSILQEHEEADIGQKPG